MHVIPCSSNKTIWNLHSILRISYICATVTVCGINNVRSKLDKLRDLTTLLESFLKVAHAKARMQVIRI